MSLLQEMEKFGLADCEFNRKLWEDEESTIKKILSLSECIEDQLIIIHTTENKQLITLAKRSIVKLEKQITQLKGSL
jgi:hypothetical protein